MIGIKARQLLKGIVFLLWAAIEARFALFHSAAGFPADAPNVFFRFLQIAGTYLLLVGLYAGLTPAFVIRLAAAHLKRLPALLVESIVLLLNIAAILGIVRGGSWTRGILLFVSWFLVSVMVLRLRARLLQLPRFWGDRWAESIATMRNLYQRTLNPQYWGNLHSIYLHEIPLLLVTIFYDFRILPLALLFVLLRLYQQTTLSQPPLVLYLASSTRHSVSRLSSIRFEAAPFRVSNLIVDESGSLPRLSLGFQDNLRTYQPEEWQDIVRNLLSLTGIIIMDLDVASAGVSIEFNEICARSLLWKTVVIDSPRSRDVVRQLASTAPAPCPEEGVAWIDEKDLFPLIKSLKSRDLALPMPDRPIGASIVAARSPAG